jgi:hypothetical protein
VSKVSFYVNNNLISEDTSAPYEALINTQAYSNGAYTLKAVVSDGRQTAESSVSVNFSNSVIDTEKPTVSFLTPLDNTYDWTGAIPNLIIQIRSQDNVGVTKIKIYINDSLAGQSNSGNADGNWPYSMSPAGTYTLKAEAYDAAGNVGEVSVVVNKS